MEEAAEEAISERESSPEPKRRGRKRKTATPAEDAVDEPEPEPTPPEAPSTRRTRSQAAPDWTTKEAMILVNEIAAIEGDWLKALSSYQKWKIVVENCNAMDVRRNLYQCRGKWKSLLSDYNLIKQWGCKARQGSDPYWSLGCERRKQFGLPENFDHEVFKAIDEYVRSQADELDSDPETDPEAEAELLQVIARLGSKRKKRYISVLEVEEAEPLQGHAEGLSQGSDAEEMPQPYYPEEGEAEERPQPYYPEEEGEDPSEESPVEEAYQTPLLTEEKQNEVVEVKVEKVHDVEEEKNEEEAHVEEKNEVAVEEEEAHNQSPVEEEEEEQVEEEGIQEKETNEEAVVEEEAHHQSPVLEEEKQQQEEENIQTQETNEAAVVEEVAHHEIPLEEAQEQEKVQEDIQKINAEDGECGHGQQKMPRVEEEKGDSYDDSESMPSGEMEVDKNGGDGDEKSRLALGEQRPNKRGRKPKALVEEEKMVQQVYENAQLMIAIAEAKYPTSPPEPGLVDDDHHHEALEAAKTEFVRRQADQLIACLGKILSILEQYPYLVKKYS